MNRERIQRAIDALEGLKLGPLDQIRMEIWLDDDLDCGTAGCAFGWLIKLGTFTAEGLAHDRETGAPTYQGAYGASAIGHLFDIYRNQAVEIFIPDKGPQHGYPARDAVVAKLRKLLEMKP